MFSLVGKVVAFSVLCCSFAAASTIKFTPANASFVPGLLYEDVELTCEVEESKVKSNNVKEVMSIIISKVINGSSQFVAIISDDGPARVAADQKDVEVYGDVSGTTGMKSYLRLKWTKPTLTLAGTYKCFIAVLTAHDLPDSLSSSVQVVGNAPRILDFANMVKELETKNQELSVEVKQLQKSSIEQANIVKELETNNQELSVEVKQLKKSSDEQVLSIDKRTRQESPGTIDKRETSSVASFTQIRQGYVNCGGHRWSHGNFGSRFVVISFFPNYFQRKPVVFLSVREFRSAVDKKYVLIHYRASEVSRTHTTIECVKSEQDGYIPFFYVNWIAFPQ